MTTQRAGPSAEARNRASDARDQTRVRVLGAAAASGAAVFLAALVGLHLLRPDLSTVRDFVSDYANGPYGTLFIVAGLLHGLGNLALTVGLLYTAGETRAGRWGVALLAVSSVGLLTGAAFPTDPPGAPTTTVGLIHRTSAYLSFPVELVALTLFAIVFADRLAWRTHARLTRVTCLLAAVALVWLVVVLSAGGPPGVPERGALAAFLVWELGTGLRLLISPGEGGRVHLRQRRRTAR